MLWLLIVAPPIFGGSVILYIMRRLMIVALLNFTFYNITISIAKLFFITSYANADQIKFEYVQQRTICSKLNDCNQMQSGCGIIYANEMNSSSLSF